MERERRVYADPCGGCVCNHCANSVECIDMCLGEMEFACFSCDECTRYDGKGQDNYKDQCGDFKITEAHARQRRKNFRVLKQNR